MLAAQPPNLRCPLLRTRRLPWRAGLAALAAAASVGSLAQVPPPPTEAPSATSILADAPRRAQLGGGPGGRKFSSEPGPPTMLISNP